MYGQLTVTTVPGRQLSTNDRRGLTELINVVVPHVFRMNRVSDTNMLLSLLDNKQLIIKD